MIFSQLGFENLHCLQEKRFRIGQIAPLPGTVPPNCSNWRHSWDDFLPTGLYQISIAFRIKGFGIGKSPHILVQSRQIVQTDGIVGMIFSQLGFFNLHCLQEKGFRIVNRPIFQYSSAKLFKLAA
jgi:hypothetical protein